LANPKQRGIEVDEEQMLAARLAGVLFMTAGVSIALLLLLPGVEDSHWEVILGIAVACVAWSAFCLLLARPEQHGAWFWHVPATLSIFMIAGEIAT